MGTSSIVIAGFSRNGIRFITIEPRFSFWYGRFVVALVDFVEHDYLYRMLCNEFRTDDVAGYFRNFSAANSWFRVKFSRFSLLVVQWDCHIFISIPVRYARYSGDFLHLRHSLFVRMGICKTFSARNERS